MPVTELRKSLTYFLFSESGALSAILHSLAKSEILQGHGHCILEVRHSHVLKDGLKESRKGKFNPKKPLKVCVFKVFLKFSSMFL